MTLRLILPFLMLLSFTQIHAQSILGKWKTIDDETGQPKAIVEIYQKGDKYFGKIVELFRKPGEDPNPKCTECEDYRKDQPIKGMVIVSDMVLDEDEYVDGQILDPKKGSVYDCKMWLENGNLMVRGYKFFFYRTQTWYRVK